MMMTGNPDAVPHGGMGGGAGGMGGMGGGAGGMGGMGAPRRPPGIQVTQAEMDAITRLEALGFPKPACLEALRAFQGNEELAANFLFESNMDDDAAMIQAAMSQSLGDGAPAQPPAQA